jgi:cation diffusion facilitator family transporter
MPQNKNRNHLATQGIQKIQQGIFLNLVLSVVKFFAGVFGNSFALVADALESLADVFSSIIVWFGLSTASKAPDENHPFGHGKAEPMAALFVAISLITAAIFIAIESVRNILTPHELPAAFTLVVLVLVISLKEIMYRRAVKTAKEIGSLAVESDAWHHRSDALTSLAAAVGVTIAILGGKGYESADDWAALLAAVMIVYNAFLIFKPALGEMMDEAPPASFVAEIKGLARQVEGILDVEKCFIRKSGFEYFIDLHIIVDGNLTVREGHDIGHRVKDHIIKNKPQVWHVLTHVEPHDAH